MKKQVNDFIMAGKFFGLLLVFMLLIATMPIYFGRAAAELDSEEVVSGMTLSDEESSAGDAVNEESLDEEQSDEETSGEEVTEEEATEEEEDTDEESSDEEISDEEELDEEAIEEEALAEEIPPELLVGTISGQIKLDACSDTGYGLHAGPTHTEQPLNAFSVYLFAANDLNNAITKTETDANGAYIFGDLMPGDYTLVIYDDYVSSVDMLLPDTITSNNKFTTELAGNDTAAYTETVKLAATQNIRFVDAVLTLAPLVTEISAIIDISENTNIDLIPTVGYMIKGLDNPKFTYSQIGLGQALAPQYTNGRLEFHANASGKTFRIIQSGIRTNYPDLSRPKFATCIINSIEVFPNVKNLTLILEDIDFGQTGYNDVYGGILLDSGSSVTILLGEDNKYAGRPTSSYIDNSIRTYAGTHLTIDSAVASGSSQGALRVESRFPLTPAIGGFKKAGETASVITINGGTINAINNVANSTGATIGGAGAGKDDHFTNLVYEACDGDVIINGGTVTATNNGRGAAIGGGGSNVFNKIAGAGRVKITGGTVTAINSKYGAAIGSGSVIIDADLSGGPQASTGGCTISITGGTVTATADKGAGIGSGLAGFNASPGVRDITIGSGANIKAYSSGVNIVNPAYPTIISQARPAIDASILSGDGYFANARLKEVIDNNIATTLKVYANGWGAELNTLELPAKYRCFAYTTDGSTRTDNIMAYNTSAAIGPVLHDDNDESLDIFSVNSLGGYNTHLGAYSTELANRAVLPVKFNRGNYHSVTEKYVDLNGKELATQSNVLVKADNYYERDLQVKRLPEIKGYAYAGHSWIGPQDTLLQGNPRKQITGDGMIIYYVYEVPKFKITEKYVNASGAAITGLADTTTTVSYGEDYKKATGITGYTYKGYKWFSAPNSSGSDFTASTDTFIEYNNVTENMTVYLVYSPNMYTVTERFVDVSGKEIAALSTPSLSYGSIYNPDVPLKIIEGYNYKGYVWDSLPGAPQEGKPSATITDHRTIYFVYEAKIYTVTEKYVDRYGVSIPGQQDTTTQVSFNNNYNKTIPGVTGYTYKGYKWTNAPDKTGSDFTQSTATTITYNNVKGDMTVYFVYDPNTLMITEKYVDRYGVSLPGKPDTTTTVNYGSDYSKTTKISGYVYKGYKWESAPDKSGTDFTASKEATITKSNVISDMTVYLVYEQIKIIEKYVNVQTNASLHEDTEAQTDANGYYAKKPLPEITDYSVLGYYIGETFTGPYTKGSEIPPTELLDHTTVWFVYGVNRTNVTVTKKVIGDYGDRTKDFTFKIYLKDENGDPVAPGTVFIYEGDGVFNTGNNGTFTQEAEGKTTFTLKHGQKVMIKEIPATYMLCIEETTYANYTASFKEDSGLTGDNNTGFILVGSDNRFFDFENKFEITPPSGIRDNAREAIVIMALAVLIISAGFALSKFMRRRLWTR